MITFRVLSRIEFSYIDQSQIPRCTGYPLWKHLSRPSYRHCFKETPPHTWKSGTPPGGIKILRIHVSRVAGGGPFEAMDGFTEVCLLQPGEVIDAVFPGVWVKDTGAIDFPLDLKCHAEKAFRAFWGTPAGTVGGRAIVTKWQTS